MLEALNTFLRDPLLKLVWMIQYQTTVATFIEQTQGFQAMITQIIYIYKTKGTLNSVRALLNVYGYPSDVITLNEFGGSS